MAWILLNLHHAAAFFRIAAAAVPFVLAFRRTSPRYRPLWHCAF